jgi:rubrerythrin
MAKTMLSPNELMVVAIESQQRQYEFYEITGPNRGKEVEKAFIKFARHGRENGHKFRDILADVGGYQANNTCVNFAYLQGVADSSVYAGRRLAELAMKKGLTDLDAVEAALAAEKDSILFYSEARDLIPEQDIAVLDAIIKQAKDHVSELGLLVSKLRQSPALTNT